MWELDYKENWAPKNWCFWTVVLEKTLESPMGSKEIQAVNPKGNQSWIFIGRTDAWSWNSNTLATSWKELTHLKRHWCWARLKKAGGEGDNRGWDGWMTSPTQCVWVWVSSGSLWWTGKPGMLKSMGSQRIGHDRVTELNWTEIAPSKATSQLILSPKYVSVSETGSTWLRLLMRGSYLFLWDSTDVPLAPLGIHLYVSPRTQVINQDYEAGWPLKDFLLNKISFGEYK